MLDRLALDDALSVLRGESRGDVVKASQVVANAGFDPAKVTSAEERRALAARFDRDAGRHYPHWDPVHRNDRVFPLMSKEEARQFLATRGLTADADPAQDRIKARERFGRR